MAEGHFTMPEHLKQAVEGRKERQERMGREEAQLAALLVALERGGKRTGRARETQNGKISRGR